MVTRPILKIRNEGGHAFISVTGKSRLSCHARPSNAVVLEDGVPLPGPAGASHEDIRRFGGGRYSFWRDSVYFSTPDNTDPRTNGRQYVIAYRRLSSLRVPALLQRLVLPWRRAAVRLRSRLNREKVSQALWGAFYWTCFAYVAWFRRWTPRTHKDL